MPAKSKAQQQAMAIALHAPEKLHRRNRSLLRMKKSDLRDFASTKRGSLPKFARALKRKRRRKKQ
jgi:hypothetical protein